MFADGVRVPARFAMPAILALSAAAALAFARLRARRAAARWIAPIVAVALIGRRLDRTRCRFVRCP